MANDKDGDGTNLKKKSLNRRNILLGGTTLAATSAIATGSAVRVAQAQVQPAAPASGKPNILVRSLRSPREPENSIAAAEQAVCDGVENFVVDSVPGPF